MKFAPYTSASEALVRARLVSFALSAAPETARSTLIVAPAGYGKTTLLCHLKEEMANQGTRTVWLNCAPEDREPDAFLADMNGAFHAAGLTAKLMDYGIAELLGTLSASGPTALFIDEYENATSPGSDGLLEHLIRGLPEDCHLFVSAREAPDISLTKLRLDGSVRLIGANELKLSEEETRGILQGTELEDAYSDLITRSEGWPVMVQLARLDSQSSAGQPDALAPMIGQSIGIFDYLAEQILSKMSLAHRNFLLEISILSEVDTALARAITERTDADKQFHELLNLRPIVTVISEQPLTLRLHPLFRDFLRHESARHPVTNTDELNRRAALHYVTRNDLSKAIGHAANSGSEDLAASILEEAGGGLLNISEGHGRVRSYLASFSPETITRRPRLHLMRIMQRAVEGASDDWIVEFEHFLEAHRDVPDTKTDDFEMQVDLIRGMVESTENKRSTVELPQKRIDEIRSKCLARKFEDPRYLGLGLATELLYHVDYGTLTLAEQRTTDLSELFRSANFAPNFTWLSNHLSHLNLAKGDLTGAIRNAHACLGRVRDLGETRNILIRQHSHAILGQCYFEQNKFDLALEHLAKVPRLSRYSLISMLVASVCSEARIRFARGEIEQALAGLEETYAFSSSEGMPHLTVITAANIAEFLLLTGDEEGCLDWIRREDLETILAKSQLWFTRPWLETEPLIRLFTLLATKQGNLDRAHDLAHEFAVRARESGRKLMAARAELLLLEVTLKQNRRLAAQQALTRALDDTEGSTALRLFFDMSSAGLSLLKTMQRKKDQSHAKRLGEILSAIESNQEIEKPGSESVSPREKEVLIALSHGHPPKIIARNLDLSYETVRHHLKNIYAKLDVHSRDQAVDEALRRRIIS